MCIFWVYLAQFQHRVSAILTLKTLPKQKRLMNENRIYLLKWGGGGKYVSFCWLQFLAYAINITEFLSILDQMADP